MIVSQTFPTAYCKQIQHMLESHLSKSVQKPTRAADVEEWQTTCAGHVST